MARATYWEYPDVQINALDKEVEGHYHTVAVVQSHGSILSSNEHRCKWRSTGAHCGNGWDSAVEVLYFELKAKATLEFNATSQDSQADPKVKLVNY